MKFIIDKYIPFIEGVLEPYGETQYLEPSEIDARSVRDADALLIRTRTRVNAELLGQSKCRFVATATIGMDHFDMDACRKLGITALNAPGCNAPAVAQYVFATALRLIKKPTHGTVMAIIGVGNVGRIVERWAEGLGMKVLRVDPPRHEKEGGDNWHTLDEAAEMSDIITFHTPLTFEGPHKTFHLADADFFNSLKRKPIIINAARGAVVDNRAWLDAIGRGKVSASVVDVWEGEPLISTELMEAADIATPHIAGYSLDGKIRATQMILDAVSRHFGLPSLQAAARKPVTVPQTITSARALASFDPFAETETMRNALRKTTDAHTLRTTFEQLRDFYTLREEIPNNQLPEPCPEF